MFYLYNQNNSGGSFVVDNDVTHFVIIEADSTFAADAKAQSIGIYFDGVADDRDCECCGDRWYCAYPSDGTAVPMIYSDMPEDYDDMFASKGDVYCIIYYANGEVRRLVKTS